MRLLHALRSSRYRLSIFLHLILLIVSLGRHFPGGWARTRAVEVTESGEPSSAGNPLFQGRVLGVDALSSRVRRVRILTPASLNYRAGQFVGLSSHGSSSLSYFSVAHSAGGVANGELELAMGTGQRGSFEAVQVGDAIEVTGPLGTPFRDRIPHGTKHLLLIGIGTAVAPLRALAHEMRRETVVPLSLVQGARTEEELLYRAEFEAWQMEGSFHYVPVISRPALDSSSVARSGRVQAHFEAFLREGSFPIVVGHEELALDFRSRLQALGFGEAQYWVEGH